MKASKNLTRCPNCAIVLILLLCLLLSGCEAAFSGLGAEATIGAEAMGELEAGMGVEDAAAVRSLVTTNSSGELVVTNAEAANTMLSRIRLEKAFGEPPKLYVEGRTQPFAEVYSDEGKIRLLKDGSLHPIPGNIFSVEGETVNIRKDPTKFSNIETTVRKGELLVKLAERNGWYQVRLVKGAKVYNGWINAIYALPLVATLSAQIATPAGWQQMVMSSDSGLSPARPNSSTFPADPHILNPRDVWGNSVPRSNANKTTNRVQDSRPPNFTRPLPVSPTINRAISDITTPFSCRNCIFNSNTRISTSVIGKCTILENVYFVINHNGRITGDVVLNRNSTLVINGLLIGNVINYGGSIIQNNRVRGSIMKGFR